MNGLPWFRLYHEMIEDPKVGTLSDSEFRLWIELLCLACSSGGNGDTCYTEEELNWKLRRNVSETLLKLFRNGLVKQSIVSKDEKTGTKTRETITITNWMKRQYSSDVSTDRVRKYRNKLQKKEGNVSETLLKRQCNGVDTDTDTDTDVINTEINNSLLSDSGESDKTKKIKYPDNFEKFWKSYPRKTGKGKSLSAYKAIKEPKPTLKQILDSIVEHQKTEQWRTKSFIPLPATFLNQRRWEDEFTQDDFNPQPPAKNSYINPGLEIPTLC